jgi:hypothetical protein
MEEIFIPIEIPQAVWDEVRGAVTTAYRSAKDHMKTGPITVDSVHNAAEEILSYWRKARLPIFASTVTRAHSIALEVAVKTLDPEAVIRGDAPDLGSETKCFCGPRSVDVEKLLTRYTKAHPKLIFYDAMADIYYL